MSSKRAFLPILLVYLTLAVAYSALLPLAEAPDEADHYAYLRYIGLNHSLPQGPTITQSKHPPLYHAAAAALSAWTGLDFAFLRSNPDALPLGPDKPPNFFVHTSLEDFPWRDGALAMHLARLLSVALAAVTVWATWRLGQEAFPWRPAIGLLAAAFLAGLPGFLFISGAINNDNAAGAFGALALLLCAQTLNRGLTPRRSLLLGLVLGLGLLSKVGTLALWPLVALTFFGAWWQGSSQDGSSKAATGPGTLTRDENAAGTVRRPARAAIFKTAKGSAGRLRQWAMLAGHLILAWVGGLLVASPWLLRNWRLYGDPLAWDLVRATVDERLTPLTLGDIGWLFSGLHRTFWGRFGAAGQVRLPAWGYGVAAGVEVLLTAGVVWFVVSGVRYRVSGVGCRVSGGGWRVAGGEWRVSGVRCQVSGGEWQFLLLALAPALVLASIVRYSAIALGTDQARLMWPAVAALAVWAGMGLIGLADWLRARRGQQYGQPAVDGPAAARDRSLVVGFTAIMAALGATVLLGLIRPAFAPPEPVEVAASAAPLAAFGGNLELLTARLDTDVLSVGDPVALHLVWRATTVIADDLRPTVRLVHSDGWLAAEWSHAPAGGRYATDRWQAGQAVSDDYLLAPQPASPGIYHVQVAVRPFGGDWLPLAPTTSSDPFLTLGRVTYR